MQIRMNGTIFVTGKDNQMSCLQAFLGSGVVRAATLDTETVSLRSTSINKVIHLWFQVTISSNNMSLFSGLNRSSCCFVA